MNFSWLRGEGFTDEMANWSNNLRAKSAESGTGVSEKSRQIERNLGFQ